MLRAICFVAASVCAGQGVAQDFTTFKGHGGPVMALAVSDDGDLASGSFDNSVARWANRAPHWLEGHDAAVTAIAYGDGEMLFSGGDDFSVWVWAAGGEGAGLRLGAHKGKVTSLDYASGPQLLASGSWDGEVFLWPRGALEPSPLESPGAGVNAVAFDEDGAVLFVATSAGRIWRYDLQDNTKRPLVKHGFGVNRLVVGEGWLAYGAVDGGTRVIDPISGELLRDFTLDRRPILALDHDPVHQRLAVGDGQGFISIIDTRAWRYEKDFRAMRDGPVWALAFSGDGEVIHAGGIDDVIYAWPVALLDDFEPVGGPKRSFLRDAASMPNGERQFMRKCSICHGLEPSQTRKAGPTLHGLFGRRAGTLEGYRYSPTLLGSEIIWTDETVDALFAQGPDHYIPGSKMPMQVIAKPQDRADLVEFLRHATGEER